jgi:hypothetical protein
MKSARSISAYHEGGHTVIAHELGATVLAVSIADQGGRTRIKRLGCGERAILSLLAGPYAQRHHAPRSQWRNRNHTGHKSGCDFDQVTDLIYRMHGTGKVAEAYWRYVEAHAAWLVEQHWDCIDAVAKHLLKYGAVESRLLLQQIIHDQRRRR